MSGSMNTLTSTPKSSQRFHFAEGVFQVRLPRTGRMCFLMSRFASDPWPLKLA
jgi:hypothetical protein